MTPQDEAHRLTDAELAKLERRVERVYQDARDDLQKTVDDYFARFQKRDAEMKALIGTVQNGREWTVNDYKQWRLNQIARGKRFEALRDKMAERYTKANETAMSYVNDKTPGIYSLNRNYGAYTIDRATGGALTMGGDGETLDADFILYDEQTVRRLIVVEPDVMPYYPPERAVQRGIDLAYGKSQITKNVTSGILRGLSIKQMSDGLQERIQTMERNSAIRAARTAVTAAQNAGRMDSYRAAQDMGIKLKKRWLATLDGRTRHSHRRLDGETRETDEAFSNGCMYPGDPRGVPAETYNCRCTLIASLPDFDLSPGQRRARDPVTGDSVVIEEMTYSEWEGRTKKALANRSEKAYNTNTGKETRELSESPKKKLANSGERGIMAERSMAMGLRKPVSHVLTEDEIARLKQEAESIEIPTEVLLFNEGSRTGFRDYDEKIAIRGDILPDLDSTIVRDKMSSRAVLAHEYYGHYKSHPSEYAPEDWRDEFRASYNAAINTPNLTDEERAYLMLDAYDRAKEAGQFNGYNDEARRIIYGY